MQFICPLLLAIAYLGACTHVQTVQTLQPSLDDEAVTTKSGHHFDVRPAGNGWIAPTGQFITPEQVESTESVSHVRGAFEGLGLGAAAGGVAGAVTGAIVGSIREDACKNGPDFNLCLESPAVDALIFGVLGSAAGGVLGAVIGGVQGSKEVNRRSIPRLRISPTPGGANAQLTWRM